MIHSTLADEYGAACAEVNEAQAAADKIKAELIAFNESHIQGLRYTVNVSDTAPRTTVDWQRLLAEVVPNEAKRKHLIAKWSACGSPSVRVTCRALPRR